MQTRFVCLAQKFVLLCNLYIWPSESLSQVAEGHTKQWQINFSACPRGVHLLKTSPKFLCFGADDVWRARNPHSSQQGVRYARMNRERARTSLMQPHFSPKVTTSGELDLVVGAETVQIKLIVSEIYTN